MNATKHRKVKKINKTLKKYNRKIDLDKNNSEKYFLMNLTRATKPSHIKLKDDFYSYINNKWLKEYRLEREKRYITQNRF